MKLKVNDTVIIHASATISDTISTPHFGGKHGMLYGTVQKLITNNHDASFHRAVVKWSNGHTWNLPESDLSVVDSSNPPRVDPKEGLYIFLRPTKMFGGLRMGMVSEDFEPGLAPTQKNSWVSLQTKAPVPEKFTEDELLTQLSNHLPVASTHDTKIEAVNQILMANSFPAINASEVERVPLFPTIQDARASEGDCRDRGYLIFTLPE